MNYFLTDVFWVGLQGQYYIKQLTERKSSCSGCSTTASRR